MINDKWILMGTEIVKDSPNRLNGVFLGEKTGNIKKIELIGTAPYFYTYLNEDAMKRLPEIRQNFMKRDGKRWKDTILGFETVVRRHPITQEDIEVTKVYGKTIWDLYSPRGDGISNFIPEEMVFNKKHKFHDYFLNEYGLVMGMSYHITDTGFKVIEDKPTDEIMDIVNDMNIPEFLQNALVNKLLPLFFTPFPDISNHILAMDIEIDNDYKQAINPFLAKYPVSSISLYSNSYQMVYVLSDQVRDKDYDYTMPEKINITVCNSETQLIRSSLKDITKIRKEKLIETFNGDKFDMIYLMCRAHILNIHEFDREIWGRWDYRRQTGIKGINNKFLVDLYPFFSNPSIKTYSFTNKYVRNSLDDITSGLLGVSKYKFEGKINQLNAMELAYYNYIDTVRTHELMTFNDNIVPNLIFMFMRISGRTFEDVHRRKISAVLTGLINNTLYNSNTLQPNKILLQNLGKIESSAIIKGKKFQGADVLDPHELKSVGFWTEVEGMEDDEEAVTCVDFASLYPSEIKQRNISFDTVNCEHEECRHNKMPDLPHHICTIREGLMSWLIGFIRDLRVKYFKKHKKGNVVFTIVEQTLKVLINAGYGVFGSETFDYFAAPIAEGTTAYGRNDLAKVRKFCELAKVKILAGDTDSIFLYRARQVFLDALFKYVEDELNLEMGVDYRGKFMLIHEKKNYLIDNEGSLIIKGLTGKKSNTPVFVQNCFKEVMEIIKTEFHDVDKMRKSITVAILKYVKALDYREFNAIDMKKTVKLGDDLFRYKVEGQHVKAAKKLVKYLKKQIDDQSIPDHIIVPKDTYIDFVIEGNKKKREPTPIEMITSNDKIDVIYYKEALVKTLSQILKPLNIEQGQFLIDHNQLSLKDWF